MRNGRQALTGRHQLGRVHPGVPPCSLAVGLRLAVGVTSCGGSDSGASGGSVPKCSELVGIAVASDFDGCASDDGSLNASLEYDCDDGRKLLYAGPDDAPLQGFTGESWKVATDESKSAALFEACKPSK